MSEEMTGVAETPAVEDEAPADEAEVALIPCI